MGISTATKPAPNGAHLPFTVVISSAGDSSAAGNDGRQEMFRFRFGTDIPEKAADNVFPVTIECAENKPYCDEIWCTDELIETSRSGNVRIAQSESWLALHCVLPASEGQNLSDLTAQGYQKLMQIAIDRSYPELLRAWNFFPDINVGEGDQERYKQFSIGRARALGKFGISNRRIPAGTAIGARVGTDISFTILASRKPCRMIENPRQTNPYHYPAQFGSQSPSFSRAALLTMDDSTQLFLSGTASIVGFESMHAENLERQLDETLENINAVIANSPELRQHDLNLRTLDCSLRVYVRNPSQFLQIRELLSGKLGANQPVIYLLGDICRSDLLLEIEGLLWT